MSKDRLASMVTALVLSGIGGGYLWVQDVSVRLSLVEDDLGETVDVIGMLHPPSPTAALPVEPLFLTDGKEDKHEERKRALQKLRAQMESAAPGDDDDSAGGSPRPLPEPPAES